MGRFKHLMVAFTLGACGGGAGSEEACNEVQEAYDALEDDCGIPTTDLGCDAYSDVSCHELDDYFTCYADYLEDFECEDGQVTREPDFDCVFTGCCDDDSECRKEGEFCDSSSICSQCECVPLASCQQLKDSNPKYDTVSCGSNADCRNGATCSDFPGCECVSAYCEARTDAQCARDEDCPGEAGYCSAECQCGEYSEDPEGDLVDSISSNTPTFSEPWIDMVKFGAAVRALDASANLELFGNTVFECGTATDKMIVACIDDSAPFPDGEMFRATMWLNDEVPQADASHSYVYSLVLDSDGVAANDWQFNPPFDYDLFQGTDRWYQLTWDHRAQTWTLNATQVDTSQSTSSVTSAARAAVEGTRVSFFIPKSELPAATPTYRLTTFGHDGAFSESDRGADVSGTNPAQSPAVPTD